MDRALAALAGDGLVPAVDGRNNEGAANAALDVAIAALDLQLQFRPVTEIDRRAIRGVGAATRRRRQPPRGGPRLRRRRRVDARMGPPRFGHTLDEATLADLEAQLGELRTAADDEDVTQAAELGAELVKSIATARLTPGTRLVPSWACVSPNWLMNRSDDRRSPACGRPPPRPRRRQPGATERRTKPRVHVARSRSLPKYPNTAPDIARSTCAVSPGRRHWYPPHDCSRQAVGFRHPSLRSQRT